MFILLGTPECEFLTSRFFFENFGQHIDLADVCQLNNGLNGISNHLDLRLRFENQKIIKNET